MNTFWKIFTAFIFGVMLAVMVYFLIMWRTTHNAWMEARVALYECRHAPVKIDTVHDSIFIYNPVVFKPEPKPKPHDSTNVTVPNITPPIPAVEPKLCEEWYDQVYKFSTAAGSGRIRWLAYIKNCKIEEMSFPEIVAPKDIIYITKTVDTCIQKKPEYKAITHFYAFGGLAVNNFNSFPALQAGLGMSIKDKILFQPGVLYNPVDRKFYVQLSFGYFFR